MKKIIRKTLAICLSFSIALNGFAVKQIKDDELGTINVPDNCEIVSAKGGTTIAYLNGKEHQGKPIING
jgi:hypothetical protein